MIVHLRCTYGRIFAPGFCYNKRSGGRCHATGRESRDGKGEGENECLHNDENLGD